MAIGFGENIQNMFAEAQKLQERVGEMKKRIEKQEFEASSGGGMVKVRFSGAMELKCIEIDRVVINPEEVGMLEDLVKSAVNEGIKRAKENLDKELAGLAGGLPIPGLRFG